MNKKFGALLAAGALLLGGCATRYQQSGAQGGFTDLRLDDNVFKVTFDGNSFTSANQVEDMALLRASELTLAAGFHYFVVASSQANVEQIQQSTPSQVTTSGTVVGKTVQTTSKVTPGTNYTINKTSNSMIFVAFTERPSVGVPYDAKRIYESLAPKYKRR